MEKTLSNTSIYYKGILLKEQNTLIKYQKMIDEAFKILYHNEFILGVFEGTFEGKYTIVVISDLRLVSICDKEKDQFMLYKVSLSEIRKIKAIDSLVKIFLADSTLTIATHLSDTNTVKEVVRNTEEWISNRRDTICSIIEMDQMRF